MNILSIDWDFFFDESSRLPNDQCGACSWMTQCAFEEEAIRPKVATAKTRKWWNRQHTVLSLATKTPIDLLCSSRTPKAQGAELYVAECHADIWPILEEKAFVLNIDAHSDMTLPRFKAKQAQKQFPTKWQAWIDCGTWGSWSQKLLHTEVIWVPCFNSDETMTGRYFHHQKWQKVFVCQSRPWTPKGWDSRFYKFLHDLNKLMNFRSIDFVGPHKTRLARGFKRAKK